ncbi:MAG TPA: lysylphosphatidylglycerol synthase transmembrane domain-containing protein [Vicinamibacterales bacterium]|nr:lysylphosphatidylglycerol synthase transmembrane domain-containing protein [Vicinamibacterales bacterium]
MPGNLRRVVGSWWARLAITVAILAYLASAIDMRAATLAVLRVDRAYLMFVLLLVALDRAVMILRWVLLLRSSGVAIRASAAARIFLVSSFVGSFLPAGVGGDVARAYGLSRATSDSSEALASVAIDRVLGIAALLGMGIAGLMATATAVTDWRVGAGVALLAAASLALLWADRVVTALVPHAMRERGVGARLVSVGAALSRYRQRPATLVHVFGWSIAVQVLRIVQAYFLGLGLGIVVPFRYYLVFMPIGLLMLLLPISVSGFGAPQAMIVWLMRPLGVADERSFALSTLIVLTGLAGNLPGLLLWLRKTELRTKN